MSRPKYFLNIFFVCLCAFLFFYRLDHPAPWQDEAETLVLSHHVWKTGMPMASFDCLHATQGFFIETDDSHLWKWSGWLAPYVGALGFLISGGYNLFVCRLVFSIFGLFPSLHCSSGFENPMFGSPLLFFSTLPRISHSLHIFAWLDTIPC